MRNDKKAQVAGAGLVGSLLSIFLAKRGYWVEAYERRPDMRRESISAGRSINLAISARGLHALDQVGLKQEALKNAIPMKGRMIHALDGSLTFQPYGKDDSQYINSISRAWLNQTLMSAAEATGRVRIQFGHKLDAIPQDSSPVFGTDGSASVIRGELARRAGLKISEKTLEHGYKELVIPPADGGGYTMEKHALHIWPRGTYMLIALPNLDGSFTCTLFLPFEGALSFQTLREPEDVRALFQAQFSDAVPLMPSLTEDFFRNPTGQMVTVKTSPWHLGSEALLLGDAAHAIVPFFGQGMNCGFEDCVALDSLMSEKGDDWPRIFPEFYELRKQNADAIADMAVENFIEMRDKVGDPRFLLEKQVEKKLQLEFPSDYISRYGLVSFSLVPYRLAYEAGLIQAEILKELCRDLTSPQDLDMNLAAALIQERLQPFMKGSIHGLRHSR